MHIDSIRLKGQNKLINDYRDNESDIMQFFDYPVLHTYEQRVNDLADRTFNRERLVDMLQTINKQWGSPTSTDKNIERLLENNSVVVIGGQQAGLLTGPMYTINKIISIIQLSKQQEEKLGKPVIPVFWIAGEDHDFDEINHIHVLSGNEMEKRTLWQRGVEQKPISNISLDHEVANNWLAELFEELQETEYTKDIYGIVKECLDKSTTYVDFFARVIYKLFSEEGLVLIDSGHKDVRQLESDFFIEMIEKQTEISTTVYQAQEQLKQLGYSIPLDVELDDAHLFYHRNNERILLKRNDAGDWVGKQDELILTTEELLNIARYKPELLSNNVITRPLMQEMLFPTLAFIGGSGEISYWAVLKEAFHSLNIKMPPVLPRLSFTYVDQKVTKVLEKYLITIEDAINYGVDDLKINWLTSQSSPPLGEIVVQIKLAVDKVHKPLRTIANDIRPDLGDLAMKNLDHLHSDIDYLEHRLQRELEVSYKTELAEFDLINQVLYPQSGLQERVWNPLSFINEHGLSFIRNLNAATCSFEEEHFVIYL